MLNNVALNQYKAFYGHENTVDSTTYRFNCYGFIDYLLKRISLPAHETLRTRMKEMASDDLPISSDGIPCPFNLFAIFESLKNKDDTLWSYVDLRDIKPGDILVFKPPRYKPEKVASFKTPTGTHAMLVQEVLTNQTPNLHLRIIHFSQLYFSATDRNSSGFGTRELIIKDSCDIRWHDEKRW